ncbi:hypothetical protein PybrP1_004315 [[Pythium] brassicae (nom. inval.)]|nr:hypothetical protein PybrP1_004315 [[Pythium] brassicae (nom. inval.)]
MGLADWWQQQQLLRHDSDVVTARKAKRNKSERLHHHHAQAGTRRAHAMASGGIFQQALAARFFARRGSSAAGAPEGLLKPSCDDAKEPLDATAQRNSGASRLRALFSRSPALTPEHCGHLTVLEMAPPPAWRASETVVDWEAEVHAALAVDGAAFQLASDGCGGVYFLHPAAAPLGVFKPRDEEYMAPRNPRGFVKEHAVVGETEHPVNKGFRIGNGALRERAAYELDAAYGGFSGVPVTTVMTLAQRPGEPATEGSVQRFVVSECSAEDMGTLKFAIPEVHKVGILDVRLFNTDRHAGNILLTPRAEEPTYGMTPIDHGFCLPSYRHLDGATFDWLQWPQAQFPFTGAELDHIASLSAARDAETLRALGIDEESVTTMRLSTALLQIGADAGFSLFEIASCLQRDGDFSSPSIFENLVANAATAVEGVSGSAAVDECAFYDALVAEVARAATVMFAALPKKKVRSISCFS